MNTTPKPSVLAVMDIAADLLSISTEKQPFDDGEELRKARIAVHDLIERVDYLCRTGEGMLALRAALSRVQGGAA